nr:immunoglobulin heavy chain junction region [Macaca mulatta]MOV53998.1 immunoglobulin heavy chain junction region [Macaca mulatta]MOV54266.1 immunoglobulin heavy chain junction region [Macaca mulatta]MOV57342.1 immunoglobulin heavy chain junction region [Macaca mulatta]MOV57436.1 immunoglobulin heavy chain junction region [Macaca mulatta]
CAKYMVVSATETDGYDRFAVW